MKVIVHDDNGDVLMQLDTDQDREQVCPSLADNNRVRDLLIDAHGHPRDGQASALGAATYRQGVE